MVKQKNRLTTMGKYWLGEKSTYPVPNLDHASQHESHPGRDRSCLPCTARLSSRRSQIRQPENRHPYRPSVSCLPCRYPAPPSLCSAQEPTSNSTKTSWPTLDRLPHTPSTAGPRIDPRIDQDRAAYPAPSNTQPHTTVPDSTESNSTKSNSTTLHRSSGDDASKKAHNPYKSPEIRRTHWGNRGEGRLTLSRS